MIATSQFIVGTSGYSFADWVGTWYPPGTRQKDMFSYYAQRLPTVELNFTFYRIPAPGTLDRMAETAPEGFDFWVKANQELTHKYNRKVAPEFLASLAPLTEARKLAGLLLQFPQSFHRTVENRKYLATLLTDLAPAGQLAVEFRHRTWEHPSVATGLRQRNVALVVPDEPDIASLYRAAPTITAPVGYLRLHSRNPDLWYSGPAERYDYSYSQGELQQIVAEWTQLPQPAEKVYVYFNNCHRGQAAQNAQLLRTMLGQGER